MVVPNEAISKKPPNLVGVRLEEQDWNKWFSDKINITSKYYLSEPDEYGICTILKKTTQPDPKEDPQPDQ